MRESNPTKTDTAEANAELIRSGYEAFARGDNQGAFALFAKDILWNETRCLSMLPRRHTLMGVGAAYKLDETSPDTVIVFFSRLRLTRSGNSSVSHERFLGHSP